MGGASSEVDSTTKNVLIEAALFDPISIARTARRHKLPSEASKRFERGVDPEVGPIAAARVAQLLIELAGGELNGVGSSYETEVAKVEIELPFDDAVTVTPPSWRPDLRHKTDLVEEIARLAGYHLIPSRIPVAPPGRGLTPRQQFRRRALSALAGAGFTEVLNYPFYSEQQNKEFSHSPALRLENPMQGESPELRNSMLPGLLQAAARNLSRGTTDLALVEEGSVFFPAAGHATTSLPVGNVRPSHEQLAELNGSIPVQPRHLAGVALGDWLPQAPGQQAAQAGYPQAILAVEQIARAAGVEFSIRQATPVGYHPGRAAEVLVSGEVVGQLGEVDPAIAAEYHLPRRVAAFEVNLDAIFSHAPQVLQAAELRVMPAATQDLSLLVDAAVPAGELMTVIREGAGELLEDVSLVDDYRGDNVPQGSKSVTFSLRFRAADRTLTQAEASQSKDAAVALANQKFGATLRA
jgi:phenylalanyl-tRNA synthetase beta chain